MKKTSGKNNKAKKLSPAKLKKVKGGAILASSKLSAVSANRLGSSLDTVSAVNSRQCPTYTNAK